ncbi:ABC transporter permease [Pseudonocardiaceae bacterium YIM PH 21723]|nr:ABC transporter permease [Pseudonocardiaceae bacterium YIM PH 21723]
MRSTVQGVKEGLSPAVSPVGQLYAFFMDTLVGFGRAIARRRFEVRDTVDQTWFLASVTTLPAVLVMIPLGVVVSVGIGGPTTQLGAQAYGGAITAFVVIGQAAPMVCALMIAGVGGSAMTADLGARKIREETDALEVMGISTIERLVVPRVAAAILVTLLLDALVMAVGILVSFAFQVFVFDVTAGAFLETMTRFARTEDFGVSLVKAGAFALLSAIVACHKGLTAKGGPGGVGQAVNEAVVVSFILVFVANVGISQLYQLFIPAQGTY